jgi:hypothetical protein
MAACVALVFSGIVVYAKLSHHWKTPVPTWVYQELIPVADQVSHPMPGDEALK